MEFNFAEKVNVLGEDFTIEIKKVEDDKELSKKHAAGYCAFLSKKIILRDASARVEAETVSEEDAIIGMKHTLRHEIVHAFLSESGLRQEARHVSGWATNEEMVDWMAIQGPKIYKAWQEAGAL